MNIDQSPLDWQCSQVPHSVPRPWRGFTPRLSRLEQLKCWGMSTVAADEITEPR